MKQVDEQFRKSFVLWIRGEAIRKGWISYSPLTDYDREALREPNPMLVRRCDSRLNVPHCGNPNPKKFTILRHFEYPHPRGSRTVVEVLYPDAKNFEGRKIMLYLCDFATVAQQSTLDPHFCDNIMAKAHGSDYVSPFARFEPTIDGWRAALFTATCLP